MMVTILWDLSFAKMNLLTDQEKAEKLVSLISKDRSRDMSMFLHIGRTLINIFNGDNKALLLWKSCSVEEMVSACDEYWPVMSTERITPRMFMKIGEFLATMPGVDIQDIDCVRNTLTKLSHCSEESFKMIQRLNSVKNNLPVLLSKKIDIRVFEQYKYRYNIRTLENWAYSDNQEIYEKLVNSNYVDDTVYDIYFGSRVWADVQISIIAGDKSTANLRDLIKLLRSSVGCVKKGKGFFVMNDTDNISICTESQFLSLCSRIKVKRLNNITLDIVVSEYIIHLVYRDIVYSPCIKDISVLNTFRGYVAKEISNVDQDSVNIVLDHIESILCNNNANVYEYILNWMSFVIQRPEKVGVVIMMVGRQGIGKTIFWEWFADTIIGMNNSFVTATLSSISGKFNGHIASKRFILVNECKGSSKHDHEELKTLISDTYIRLERKGHDAVQINSSHCIVITSNHRDHTFIDEDDRRFFVLECSTEKKDPSYFTKLASTMDTCSDSFYTFLLKRDISEFTPSTIPETPIKEDIKESNTNSVRKFLQDNKWNNWKLGSIIYSDYKDWCSKMGMQFVPSNRFKIFAENMIEVKKTNKGVQYKLSNLIC